MSYWATKCLFYINNDLKTGVCKTCKKPMPIKYLKSADPRNSSLSILGPHLLTRNVKCLNAEKNN